MTQAVTDTQQAVRPAVEVDVVDAEGTTTGKVSVPGEIFDAQANIPLMHQVVVAQLAAARQGTHKTKSRGEVAGGGRKPYRQKGTGRARQGSIRAPQFAGGGVVHGPVPRDYTKKVPKKMKAAALRGALSDRARDGRLHVVSALIDAEVPSTRTALEALENVVESRTALVVIDRDDEVTWKSLRNVPTVHLLTPDQLNTYDVLDHEHLVFTTAALRAFLGGELEITEVEVKPKKKAAKKSEGKQAGSKAKKTTPKKPAVKAAKQAEDEPDEATEAEETAEPQAGPYAGSVLPPEDGSVPEGYPIKANEQSGLYHEPGGRSYKQTKAEFFFATVEDAEQAGFAAPGSKNDADEEETK